MRTVCFYNVMIMSPALLDRGVDATVDDSCDDANMQYVTVEWWLAVETGKKRRLDLYLYNKCRSFQKLFSLNKFIGL